MNTLFIATATAATVYFTIGFILHLICGWHQCRRLNLAIAPTESEELSIDELIDTDWIDRRADELGVLPTLDEFLTPPPAAPMAVNFYARVEPAPQPESAPELAPDYTSMNKKALQAACKEAGIKYRHANGRDRHLTVAQMRAALQAQ